MRTLVTKLLIALTLTVLLCRPVPLRAANILGDRITQEDFKRIKADHWRLVGKNIIASGNVHIPFANFDLRADQVVVNLESRDLEAVGNISLHRWQTGKVTVSPDEVEEVAHRNNIRIRVIGASGDIWGNRKIALEVRRAADNIVAHRVSGNLKTGYFSFDRAQLHFSNFVCRAGSGERKPNGVIELYDAEMSACGYLEHDNAHYSFSAKHMTLTPFAPDSFEMYQYDFGSGSGDYAIWMTNGWAKIYGVPVLWLPAFYKPRDESPGICSIVFGRSKDWGFFVSMRKRFYLTDYPTTSVQLMGDYYSLRGFGYGVNGYFNTDNSRTDFFAYSIYDNHPYAESDYHKYRFKIPANRYDFRVSNVTHITPRLDFRATLEYTSDYFFNNDFFSSRYSANPQPSTYAALEQQFDIFSVSTYFRARINKFYSTVEKLPEVRVDLQRQQIFNTPFYYQGDLSADYMRMKWIVFERRPDPNKNFKDYRLDDYEAFRLDTTHFIYLPLQKYGFSLIPRAGAKLTAYSNSSKHGVSSSELIRLFNAANPTSTGVGNLDNYDHRGGSRVRVIGELGAEASFKIHNTWQNARSDFLGIDGLRHVMRPYINYTYISRPNVDRKYLFYFDDIDRIEKENFFRFGLENRLQTRSGSEGVREYLKMENYWDLYLERSDEDSKLSNIGNFCTKLSFSPIRNLTVSTEFSIDAGGNNEPDSYNRRGRKRNPGIQAKWLNRWKLSIAYSPIKDFFLKFSYQYNRPFNARSAYSMGTTLTLLDAGSYFNCYRNKRSETFTFEAGAPLTPDRRTFGVFHMEYDVLDGGFSTIGFMITRQFHCIEVIAALSFDRDNDDDGTTWDTNVSVQVRLLGLEMPVQGEHNQMLSRANDIAFGNESSKGLW